MKSNDGMTALGTYAISGLKTKPATGDYEAGVVAGQDLPEAWWNFFLNAFTSNGDITKDRVANILAELTTVLSSSGLSPDNATTTQVDAALKAKYMSRLGIVVTDFNAIVTSSLPQGSVTSFYTDTGYTNGPSGATVQTGFILRSKVAADSCILIAFGNVTAVGVSNYPIYFRVRTAGTWLGWTSVLGGNNASSAATASALMLRDAAGRSKVAAPAAEDDVARKAEITAEVTARNLAIAAEATLARNASNLSSGVVPFAVLPLKAGGIPLTGQPVDYQVPNMLVGEIFIVYSNFVDGTYYIKTPIESGTYWCSYIFGATAQTSSLFNGGSTNIVGRSSNVTMLIIRIS